MLALTFDDLGEGCSVFHLKGDVDAYTVDAFRAAVAGVAPRSTVVLDLSAVLFIDSAGLRALIGGIRRLREGGGTVAVACARPSLVRLLRTTGFEQVVSIAESVGAARQLLTEPSSPSAPKPGQDLGRIAVA